jgi:hypothetical protein
MLGTTEFLGLRIPLVLCALFNRRFRVIKNCGIKDIFVAASRRIKTKYARKSFSHLQPCVIVLNIKCAFTYAAIFPIHIFCVGVCKHAVWHPFSDLTISVGQRYSKMYRLKRYRYTIFEKKIG